MLGERNDGEENTRYRKEYEMVGEKTRWRGKTRCMGKNKMAEKIITAGIKKDARKRKMAGKKDGGEKER